MGQKLQNLVGILKDKASLTLTSHSPDAAVLRATSHSPSFDARHVSSLLSFGSSSRISASSLVASLSARLSSARDASVALKCLLSLHHILANGSFILLDSIYSSFLPSSGRRSPLNLSSFRSSASLPLSSWVRHYARLLELLLLVKPLNSEPDDLSSSLNKDVLRELQLVISALEEMTVRMPTLENNALVMEVVCTVEKERLDVVHAIRVRVTEVKERVGELGFGDAVESVCLVRRMEELGAKNVDASLMREMKELRERVGDKVVVEERGRIRRDKGTSESARINLDRRSGDEPVRFGLSRWVSA